MKKLVQNVRKVKGLEKLNGMEIDSRIELIQSLIPLGLMVVEEELQREVEALAGKAYQREADKICVRWGSQPGSIYLADQKVSLRVPRVRNKMLKQEVQLSAYQRLQSTRKAEESVFKKVLKGLSLRNYGECSRLVPEAFGLSPSNLSRKYVSVSSKKLKELFERKLDNHDIVAVFLDGKSFKEQQMVIALGVTEEGEKTVLGFIEAGTEKERGCTDFLKQLIDRGLRYEEGLLFVIDGSKGLRKAISKVFGDKGIVQRCQWHKRENVVSYLPKTQQAGVRKKLQAAYQRATYNEAKEAISKVAKELTLMNESAVRSLEEGLEETLTLHRLGLFDKLGTSFKTTNCIESLNSMVAQYTDKVDRWRNSNQRQRWLASALIEIESRLNKVRGFKYLPLLKNALRREATGEEELMAA